MAADDLTQIGYLELCNAQLMMWFDAQVSNSSGYRLGGWMKTDQVFDADDFSKALTLLTQSHEALRLRVDPDRPRQWIVPDCTPPLSVFELQSDDPDGDFQKHLEEMFKEPLPFGDDPLWRVHLLQMGGFSYVALNFHHMIVDTVSVQLALAQLLQAYMGVISGQLNVDLPQSSVGPVLDSDIDYNRSAQFQRDLSHWTARYETVPPRLITAEPTPTDDPFAEIVFREISDDSGFLEAAQNANLLPHRALFGLLAVTLARRFGQTDLACGLALHRRDRNSMQTVSMLAGLIPVRATFEDWWTLEDCLAAFDEHLDEDLRHNRLPVDALYRELGMTSKGAHGLFDVTMSFVPGTTGLALPTGSSSSLVETREASPISFHATNDPKSNTFSYRLAVNPNYRNIVNAEALSDLLDAAIQQFSEGDWVDFGDVACLTETEAQALLALATPAPLPEAPLLPARIATHAAATPDAPALSEATGDALSYADMLSAARRRAHLLASKGLKPGQTAALLVDLNAQGQGQDLIISLLAIWEAGATFVPLNADDPAERLQMLASDADIAIVLTPSDHLATAASLSDTCAFDDTDIIAQEAELPDTALCTQSPDADAYIYFTSGTTGRPKAVPITHNALAAFTAAIGQTMGTSANTRALSAASPLFDAIFMDLAATLAQGGMLIRLTARNIASPAYLKAAADKHGANYLDLTPTVWRAALSTGWTPAKGFQAVTGGEAIDATLAKRITAQGATLTNSYGPTEATVVAIAAEITPEDIAQNQIPIGAPLPGTQALILDEQLNPCAPGTPGELFLAGPQLAQGYLNNKDQTDAAFIDHPNLPGQTAYRTGDLAAWRADGRIAYMGRIDDQIKIRGMRVELAEIEANLTNLPGIQDAAAAIQNGAISAFIVTSDTDTATIDPKSAPTLLDLDPEQTADIRANLARTLPEHMVPAAIAALSHIPMGASGKINKKALPELATQSDAPFEEPKGPLETLIAAHISDLLSSETGSAPDQISRHDSFFALGGHSLMAVRLIARIQDATDTQIPLRALFDAKTIKDLAVELQSAQKHAALPKISPVDRTQNIKLSYAQERLWFVERFAAPGTIAEVMGFDLEGTLDQTRLRAVFAALYARHEALRLTVDVADGSPIQRFADPSALPWTFHDLCGQTPKDQDAQIAALRARPVDPSESAFRVDLVQTAEDHHVLVLALHHMVYDGVSLAVILAEMATLWAANGSPAALPTQDIAYADFATWQRDALKDGPLKDGLDRFVATLANPPAPLAIPADRPRPDHPTHAAARTQIHLPKTLTDDLRKLAQSHNASLFIVLQTALAALMAREARTNDIIIGTVAAGRAQTEVEMAVGPFFNMIALRHAIDPTQSFKDLLGAARDQALTAFDDQLVPFEAVIERTITHRDARTAVSPLFQILFQLHTEAASLIKPLALGGLAAKPRDWGKALAMQDLTFDLFETEDGIEGRLTYATELFDAARIEALVQRYTQILTSIAQNPDAACQDLNTLPQNQAQALLALATPAPLPEAPLLPARIATHAAATPDAPALSEATGDALSYADMLSAARRRAHLLASKGLKPGQTAALLVDLNAQGQGQDLIISLLAIWEAGATFVPLNADDPAERLQMLASDADIAIVLTPSDHLATAASLSDTCAFDDTDIIAQEAELPDTALCTQSPDADAYIYFTSGTTGRPKAVPITHNALAAFTAAIGQTMGTSANTRALSAASPLFDAIFMDLAATLAQGGMLIRLTARNIASPAYLKAAADKHGANYLDLTPTVWRAALSTGWTPAKGFQAVTGGEAIDATLAKRITAQGATLTNSYGPTEATVVAIAAEITPEDIAQNQIPIGAPLPGTQALILDEQLNPCAPGTPGELFLAGPQLAQGYLNNKDQTDAAFIDHPNLPGQTAYRTGDLAAWRADGRIAYMGRIDDQIKIRGMRVELAEIEANLTNLPGIQDAAAAIQNGAISAFIVTSDTDTATIDPKSAPTLLDLDPEQTADIRANLARTLPEHMVPAAIAALSHIPMGASGKINKKALPELATQSDAPFEEPKGPLETLIAAHISDLLSSETGSAPDQISRHDSFFALGGHSLMAVRLIARIQDATDTQIPLRALFDAKTIKDLAVELQSAQKHAALPKISPVDRTQNIKLSYAQERLWFVERFAAPGTIAEVMGFDLEGTLDQTRLRAVFAALYARHEALRLTVDVADGSPIQRFADPSALPWTFHDLCGQTPKDQDAQIAALRARPVDPSESAFRVDLVQTAEDHHVLVLALHHMVYDGVSLAVILAEMATLWAANGSPAALPTQDIAYADFATWQRDALKDGPLKDGLDRFVATLANPPAPLAIPADRPRPDHPTHAAARTQIHLPKTLTDDLRKLAQSHNASLFIVLQTALAALMAREARTNDIIIGTVAAGRAQTEVEMAVGPFFNMIALRHAIDPTQSFKDLLGAARDQALTAFDDQLVPFEAVIERTITHRDARTAVSPLFQILFQLHTEAASLIKPLALGGLAAKPRDWGKALAMQDLTFDLFETEDGIEGRLTYATELFDAARIEALVQRYTQILTSIAQNPDAACQDLNTLPQNQAQALLALATPAPLPEAPLLPARIATHAAATPDAPALSEATGDALSYADMLSAARRRAHLLASKGLKPGQTAALLVDLNAQGQGQDLIISLLAIWEAGATFVPLNADDPAERLQMLASDADIAIVLTPSDHLATAASLSDTCAFDDTDIIAQEAELPDTALCTQSPDADAYIYFTSGTTGRPKAVPITHNALAAFTAAIGQTMGTSANTRALSAASPLFDAIFMDLAATLAQGGMLIRLTARNIASPAYLKAAADKHGANYLDLTPTVWRAALSTGWTPAKGFQAVTGGEAIDATLAKRITAQGATLTNSYGPTEATVVAIAAEITPEDIAQNQIPIGAPLPGTQALILDEQLNPCAPGTPGELFLAGPQLAQGYLNNKDQTDAAFIDHPNLPGQTAYRTGDLAAWRADGRIAYMGRIDDQIKIRGMRVELAEIEANLTNLPGIQDAAAAIQNGAISAFIVTSDTDTATIDPKSAPTLLDLDPEQTADIRANLARTLPEHMVPAAIAALSHIPMGASGKINKKALPELATQSDAPFEEPKGPLETLIAAHISDLLSSETGSAPDQISRHDSFFALGGHSLMAVRLIARIQDATDTQIPLRALFDAKTIKDLAVELQSAQKHAALPKISPVDRTQNIKLSYAQERLWFVERFAAPGTIAEVMGFDLEGTLDQTRLRAVFAALYARHEALRLTVDVADGSPIQRFADPSALPWTFHDLCGQTPKDQDAQIAALRARPVDPSESAFRVDLVQTAEDHHVLVLALHHMVYDGVSLAVILAEMATLWAANGSPAALPTQDIAYADFATWQRDALKDGPLKDGLDRFVATLANPPAPLAIPADRPRPDHPTHAAARTQIHLPKTLTDDLRKLAQSHNASLFIVLQTALAALMAREARTNDIIIGTVAAGRAQTEVEMAVGPFFNMIALRHAIDPTQSFKDLLGAARDQALTAFDDQLVPFEAVIERTITHRDARTAVSPLFQILFQLHTEAASLIKPLALGGLAAKPRDWGKALAMQDLTFDLFETEDGIEGRLTYATELFDAARIEALVQRYTQILTSIAQNPDAACQDLNTLPQNQAQALLALATPAPLPEAPLLPARIATHAAATPDAPALSEATGDALSYADMLSAARRRAHLLASKGLKPGQTAALLVDLNAQGQGQDLIISLLAIWEAGATFVPLNADDPAERLQMLASDADIAIVLTPSDHLATAASLSDTCAFDDTDIIAQEAELPDTALCTQSPDADAYIYFTSGTTGRPKAVPITHNALAAFTAAIGQTMGTSANTRALSAASPLFDAIFMDLAATLAQGGMLIRLTARNIASPAYLKAAADKHGANYLDLTPTVWRAALSTGWTPAKGFQAVTGGEAIDATLAKRITAQGATLTNSYGPTEATVVAIAAEITPEDIAQNQIPIGAPLPGTQALILDEQLNPCAPGTPGELFLAGPQLAQGYLNNKDQTDAAFIDHPNLPGQTAYRTGDLAAWRADGRIAYMGRIDDQIKIRGMRVELAEIEANLTNLPGIQDAAAAIQNGAISAFIVTSDTDTATIDPKSAPTLLDLDPEQTADIRANLARTLPEHMVPAAIAALSHIPMGASGKINKKALPELATQSDAPFEEPKGPLETLIAAHISDLLSSETGSAPDQISRHDSFFALGGHSLMAVRLIARIQDATDTQIPLRALFDAKTIKDLAVELQSAQKHAALPKISPVDRTQNIKLSYAQERLWFVERFAAPGTIAEVMGFDLEGALDQTRLRAVFAALYARHEALRLTVDVADGSPIQRFADPSALPWTFHDLCGQTPKDQDAQIAALRARPVDPSESAFRVDLVQTAEDHHVLVLALHHMVYDGVSLAVILAEMATLWAANGSPAALPTQDIAYADFATWQRDALKDGPLKDGLDRFVATLANPPAPLAIPADRPRPDHPTHAAARTQIHLPKTLTDDLRKLAQSHNASLFIVLQTALAALMAREARTNDIIIGTVAAGRAQTEVEMAVGPFFNMIALRHAIDPTQSFKDLLGAARDQALTAFDDQLVPFEAVIERTITHRDARTAVSPLFQILFQLHTEAASLIKPLALGGLAAKPRDWGKALAMQDLTFDLFETEDGIEGRLTYATELFDAARIEALVQRYTQILTSIAQNPDAACQDLNTLPQNQAQALLALATPAPLPEAPLLPARIATHAAATPDAPALSEATGDALSYADMLSAARRRAHLLASKGLKPGQTAALLVDLNAQGQGQDLIISLLAIWEAGATFVPLNADDPAERLQMLASDADIAIVLTPSDHLATAASLSDTCAFDDTDIIAQEAELPDTALCTQSPDADAYIYFTSGTTGRPKAVPITHNALAAFTAAIGQTMGTSANTRALSAASPLFDAIFMDLAATLAQGGMLIRLTARNIASPAYLKAAADKHGANYLDLTPTVWRAALSTGWTPAKGFQAVTGGEAIDATLAKRITAQGATLTNSYGPTEATVVAIAAEITPEDIAQNQIPIGAPLPGTQALILDEQLNPCAPGTPGELFLAGPQLAQGYLNNKDQTDAAFIDHPSLPGQTAYRTGDLAAWRADGRIAYMGRIDDQIKIRGMRVELAEIEANLTNLPGIQDAAAAIQNGAISAFIVTSDTDTATIDPKSAPTLLDLDPEQTADIRANLARTLPEHMVPAAIAALSHIPMGASGKINKKALPELATQSDAPFEEPKGPLETLIAAHISDLLSSETGSAPDQISRHDSFFALGGHSLMAVRLIARIQDATDTQIPLRALFDAKTIKDLAVELQSAQKHAALPKISPVDRTQNIKLSYAQERLWFLNQLDPATTGVYRIDGALRLNGDLQTDALATAFDDIVNRHDSLRSRFKDEGTGQPWVDLAPDAKTLGFAMERVSATEGDDLDAIVADFLNQPYDMTNGPLFRALLVEVAPDDHILAIGGHHVILDGWSVALLFHEVSEQYRAKIANQPTTLEPLALQFGDYAGWQRELFAGEELQTELGWWRDRLAGAPEAIALPSDRPRPEVMDYRGRSVRAQIAPEVVAALTSAAQSESATLFMGLEAALAAYLMRLGAGEDVVIGTAVAGRPKQELDSMVGFFINTLALRNQVTPDQTLREQMRHARDVTLDAFDHQHLPFDAVIDALRPVRSMRHAPLVQVMLVLQNVPRASEVLDLGGLEVDYFGDRMAEKGAQFDMTFEFAETPEGLEGILTYSTALFDDASAKRLLDGFAAFIEAGARAPETKLGQLPLMADYAAAEVEQFQSAQTLTNVQRVPDLIAQADPKRPAVTDEDGAWLTYQALQARSDQIGAAMQAAGVKADTVVGLCLSRKTDLPAAMLAAWKIGAAFVPVNPNDPAERRSYMLENAGALALVMDEETAERVQDITLPQINVTDLTGEAKLTPAQGHLAYVIFTSGSTGKPKGVAVNHASLGHLHAAVMQDRPMTSDECLISGFETTFDVFVRDVALTLASGARLVLAQPRNLLKPGYYQALVEKHDATWLQLTPTVWRVAMADGWRPSANMRAEAGGEAMDAELAALLGENGAMVVNAYGPTEVTAVSVQGIPTQADIDAKGAIPIGKPLPGTNAYVLDAQLNPVPVGVAGELVLGGPQVADGYIGRPEQTAEVFIADPVTPDQRAYRTGDLVKWLPDGRLEFLGRIDAQVKIRGMRVELTEIEAALANLPQVVSAAVGAPKDAQGQTRLVAYLTTEDSATQNTPKVLDLAPLDAGVMRTELAKTLPEHMIPQSFARLSHLPLTPSGKLDRKALPEVAADLAQAEYVAPEGPMEELVADEIGKLLGENVAPDASAPDRIGRHDGFFALGGHSLLAVQLVSRLEAATGLTVPLRAIFDAKDIADLAKIIDGLLDGEMPGAEAEVDDANRDIAQVDNLPQAPAGKPADLENAETILLTGGTGFLGRYLLRDLLNRTNAQIICVARGKDAESARDRVLGALEDIPGVYLPKDYKSRVEVALGDLAKPDLGLSAEDRTRIIKDADVILHNGAEVHSIKPYAMLRTSNAMSVLDLLRMMSEGRPKSMVFVSALSVLEVDLDALRCGFDPEVKEPALLSGYTLSKWAGERMLVEARAKGYESTILRPGLVIGDSKTGYYENNDIGQGFIRLFMGTKSVPNVMSSFEMPWINVDRASEMMLDMTQAEIPHGIGHVFDQGAIPSDVLAEALGVEVVNVKAWLNDAIALLEADPEHASSWLLPRLRGHATDLEPIPDEMVPVEEAASMLERFAPPELPQIASHNNKPKPVDGLKPSFEWLAARKKD